MTSQEIDILLTDRCKNLDLKGRAFQILDRIFTNNSNDKKFLCGFERSEIKLAFDRFEFQIGNRKGISCIKTRIGLYVTDKTKVWLDNMEPIGYYELETDVNGDVLDDFFVIEKEKFVKDIEIISHFQKMNNKLPNEYLRRNHIQYEFVSYISLVGTLFISKQFEGCGRFIQRAYTYLKETDNTLLDKDYLKESTLFLTMVTSYLLTNNLVTDGLQQELSENKSCG